LAVGPAVAQIGARDDLPLHQAGELLTDAGRRTVQVGP
jgi:hypothetical protein